MMYRLASVLLLVSLGTPAWADGEWRAWLGLRDGRLAHFDQDVLIEGHAAGWHNDLVLRPWLRLRLGADHARVAAQAVEARGSRRDSAPGYRLDQTLWRVGLVPRLQAGPATLSLGAEWLRLHSEEDGPDAGLFGPGRRQRSGFGIGGRSQMWLAPDLQLIGEAAGYRLAELEWIDAGMRQEWQPRDRRLGGLRLSLEGLERRISGPDHELRERDVRLGLGRAF